MRRLKTNVKEHDIYIRFFEDDPVLRLNLRLREAVTMPRVVSQARKWTFTSFQTGLAPSLANKEIQNGTPRLRYLVFQKEVCPETNREHLQGYAEFCGPVRRTAFQRWIGDGGAHCEAARGSAEENRDYCTKEASRLEGPWEVGDPSTQGARTDLEGLHQALRNQAATYDLWEDHFSVMVRYHRSVDAYRLAVAPKAREPPEVVCYWGPTGTGKTRRVHWETGDQCVTIDTPHRGGTPWFDGYEGQPDVLFDDYGGEYGIHYLKRLLDRYNMKVQVKGGFSWWTPKRIFLTSNTEPQHWYPEAARIDNDAILRRITRIEEHQEEWIPPIQDAQESIESFSSPDLV